MSDEQNVYLIKDSGDDGCWKGATMQEAVQAAEDAYINGERDAVDFNEKDLRAYYQSDLLESCTLIAELKNP